MNISRWMLRTATLVAALFGASATLSAQGVTTGAVSGTITSVQGQALEGAQVQITNRATGAKTGSITRADGRYFIQSLDVGGPYTVSVRRIGFAPQDSNNVYVSLGQNVRIDFRLGTQAAQLSGVTVTATTTSAVISASRQGPQTTVTDSAVARLPTINRNFTDFLQLTPQISTKGPGNSGGGMNNRFNAIQIDGAVATDLFGLGSTGQPGGQANAKQIPLGAVKEYEVLLAPFDVRQGNFTGALVNAVTKSGTNEFHGEAFGYYRNEQLEANVPFLRSQPFTQDQFGLSMGGPIVQDRLHFFVSAEKQNKDTPASGPYFNQPASTIPAVPVSQTDFTRFQQILQTQYGYSDIGNGNQFKDNNPLTNVFVRFDLENLPLNSRLVARYNYAGANIDVFSRSASIFNASNNGYNFADKTNSELAQLFTNFTNGGTNELLAGYTTISDIRVVPIEAPFVTVNNVPNPTGGVAALRAGTENSSQGNALKQNILELTDNYTIPWRANRFTLGTKNTFYKVYNLFSQNSLGNYTFGSLDSLAAGQPRTVTIGKKLDNSDGAARFNAHTYGFYAQDDIQPTENLNLTLGVRADIPGVNTTPGTNPTILSTLAINTANVPKNTVQWAPRFGFNWDVTGDQVNQLRGGVGLFVGQPAWVWISNVFGNSGVNGFAGFTCSTPATSPAFVGNNGPVPQACANGSANTSVTVNTIDPHLRFPSAWRSSLGYDRRLPWGVIGTLEGIYTRMQDQFLYSNISLQNPIGVDNHGRTLFANLAPSGGQSTNLADPHILAAGSATQHLGDVINLSNQTQNKDYAYDPTAQLQKRFSDNFEGMIAYTFAHSYDQYDITSSVAYSNWQFGRDYAGPQNAQNLAYSKFDVPHRVVASGTYTLPTKTDISFIFTGESGVPYTWIYSGDINADGSGNNDPIYVPTNAHLASEITFQPNGNLSVAAQQDSLEAFINRNPCVASQRGQIMARNSCRFPWTKEVDLSVRQSLRSLHAQNVILELDAFNFLNLLNKNWGVQPGAGQSTNDPFILTRRSYTGGNDLTNGARPVFIYSPNFNVVTNQNVASNYRLQAQIKYTF